MRKAIIVALVLGLVAGSLSAPAVAKKKKPKKVERVVELTYDLGATGAGAPVGTGACLRPTNSCGDIPTGSTEKYVTVEITDAAGLPVAFSLTQDTDPDAIGSESDLGEFCGKTEEPIAIEPGFTIVVFPWTVGPACGSVATTGTVKATLSNLP